jgi:membrane-bound lytic murein transglycosylase B
MRRAFIHCSALLPLCAHAVTLVCLTALLVFFGSCQAAKAGKKRVSLESYKDMLELSPSANPSASMAGSSARARPQATHKKEHALPRAQQAASATSPPGESDRSRSLSRSAGKTALKDSPPLLDPSWQDLITRLEADGFTREKMEQIFSGLGPRSYSPAYMAAKITELYGAAGIGINRAGSAAPESPENYEQPLSDVTIGSCMEFIKKYAFDLAAIEDSYGVPTKVIIAILLVETNLGLDLGNDTALRALACMAATSTPALLGQRGNAGQLRRVRSAALTATLKDKSEWAYEEVRALLHYGEHYGIDVSKIPGSVYGAIGICQFMPSNIERYGVDGDKDGRVDLFSPLDAMYSVANYLSANGWRDAKTNAQQFAVIKTYNQDNFYAAHVLGVARHVDLAIAGKVPAGRNALAGIGSAVPYTDPSLRRDRRGASKIPGLGSYQGLLSR